MRLKSYWSIIKATAAGAGQDQVNSFAAAIAYYTIFSMAPLILIAVAIAGMVFGQEAAQGEIVRQLSGLVGTQGAETIQQAMASLNRPRANLIASILGFLALVLGASGVFVQLQTALNFLWKVKAKPKQSLWVTVRSRLMSFGVIAATGFLLLVSLLISAALAVIDQYLQQYLPQAALISRVVSIVISLGITTGIFMMVFKTLPDIKIGWRDVFIGGLVTAALFSIGQVLIGLYLGRSTAASAYGAAASLVIILLWVYYSSLIMLMGAEFTKQYAQSFGHRIEPADYAERRQAA